MERMEIKLKKCCLECEYFRAEGILSRGEISCSHMPVCYKYAETGGFNLIKEIAVELLEYFEFSTASNIDDILNGRCDKLLKEITKTRVKRIAEYRKVLGGEDTISKNLEEFDRIRKYKQDAKT